MSKLKDNIDTWLCEMQYDEDGNPIHFYSNFLSWLWAFPQIIYNRFNRCICAIKGCKIATYRSDYIPDDCYEWECKRCGCEGINSQVHTQHKPYDGDNKLKDLFSALRGNPE